MVEVLNPTLHRQLRRFGSVRIVNPGEAMAKPRAVLEKGQWRLSYEHAGEEYHVNCPYCTDTRRRLYVNHLYGKRSKVSGHRMLHLAICFNENCLANPDHAEDFADQLDDVEGMLERAQVRRGKVVPESARQVSWPGPCTRIDKLSKSHGARHYLLSRGFDPDTVGRLYGVSYCVDSFLPICRGRLIIPVLDHGKLKGWQARYVGELAWKDRKKRRGLPPKYFSCPNSHFRSRCIYNLKRMRQWQTGVVVEGPTDTWRFGAMSGCIFGNTVTPFQRSLLLSIFRRRTLILMLDPEEFEESSTKRCVRYFETRMPGRFCAIKLPEDTDPGSLDRDFLRDYVRQEAREHGVEVVYRKVSA